ncbi:uncharacterized protein METZ01_LOCUS169663, partial [marine metagenome]
MIRIRAYRITEIAAFVLYLSMCPPSVLFAQGRGGDRGAQAPAPLPSIAEKTVGTEKLDGFLPLYWDAVLGQLWMEIPQLNQ